MLFTEIPHIKTIHIKTIHIKKERLLSLLSLLLFCLSIMPALAEEIVPLDNIVAIVNDDVITQLELKHEFRDVVRNLKKKGAKLPPANVLGKQVLDRMILDRIQLDLARRTGIKVDDTTLNRAITRIAAQNNMSISEFREQLAAQGIDFRRFQDEIKKQIILKRLLQRNVINKVTVSDQEIENFLFNIDKQGGLEQAYHLKHILIATPEGASPEVIQQAEKKAEKVVKELRAGKDFSEMALSTSDGQNALDGGDLGWRKAGELPSIFTEVVSKMKKGEISNPIRSPSGFHIIQLVDAKGGRSHVITQTHARHILIKPSIIDDNEQVIERLKQIRNRIINGEDFATMAKAYSEDTSSAAKGGDLGWFKEGTMVPEFEAALNQLEPGEISDVIRTNFGYHIIEVLGRRTHDDADEMLKDKAREILTQRKIAEQKEAFYRRIRDEAYVEIRLDNG